MEIRRTQEKDLKEIINIYETAREFMASNGNPTQWGNNFPNIELIKGDVQKDGYVVIQDNQVIGVFVFTENAHEEAYYDIDGEWLNDKPYAVIHRCATGGTHKGVGQFLLEWCFNKFGNIRIDTHKNNIPMRNLLNKNGYKYCGKIYYKDHGERIAFQKD